MRNRTVAFDTYTSDDLKIIFTTLVIDEATIKSQEVQIPFADGSLDLTEYYGTVRFNNRKITMSFMIPFGVDHMEVYHTVASLLSGTKREIRFSAMPEWYWVGRLQVGGFQVSGGRWVFDIVANCEPYMYHDVTHSGTYTSATDITLWNDYRDVAITVTTDSEITLAMGDNSATVSAGTYTVNAITLTNGANTVTVTPADSSADVTITYTEARL